MYLLMTGVETSN